MSLFPKKVQYPFKVEGLLCSKMAALLTH